MLNEEIIVSIGLTIFYIIVVVSIKKNLKLFFYNQIRFIYLVFIFLFTFNNSLITNFAVCRKFFRKYKKLVYKKEFSFVFKCFNYFSKFNRKIIIKIKNLLFYCSKIIG